MKRCPTCSRVFDDVQLRFCLDDGTVLVNKVDAAAVSPTLVLLAQDNLPTMRQDFRPEVAPVQQPVAASDARKRSLLPWLLGLGALLLFLGSGTVAAVLVLRHYRPPLVWHLTMEVDPNTPDREAAASQTIEVIEKRLSAYGVSNFRVVSQGNGRILLNLPLLGIRDPERLKSLIISGGKLELVAVISPPSPAPVQTYSTREDAIASLGSDGSIRSNRRVLPYTVDELSIPPGSAKWGVVELPVIVNGSELRDASASRTASGGDNYEIDFWLNKTGADKFGAWTGANINQYLGVTLNDEVKSIAYIKSQIFDQGQITGRFTKQSAEDLALVLKSGALPVRVQYVSETIDK